MYDTHTRYQERVLGLLASIWFTKTRKRSFQTSYLFPFLKNYYSDIQLSGFSFLHLWAGLSQLGFMIGGFSRILFVGFLDVELIIFCEEKLCVCFSF